MGICWGWWWDEEGEEDLGGLMIISDSSRTWAPNVAPHCGVYSQPGGLGAQKGNVGGWLSPRCSIFPRKGYF